MDIGMDILCCQITIGDADKNNPIIIRNGKVFTEVIGIEINETFKKLIGTAKIKLAKGTVYKSTIIGNATMNGEDASKMTTEIMQNGCVVEKRTNHTLVDDKTFKIEQRVNIKLGYNGELKNMFDGYITAYNSDDMFQIECENMAYLLKLKQSPKFETPEKGTYVNDVMGEKYGLLKNTGFKIHSETLKSKIEVGKIKITDNFTVADILTSWSKMKVFCFLKYDAETSDNMPTIAIGRPYSYVKNKLNFSDDNPVPLKIYFNYHVASNNLKVLKTEPKFLAIQGKGLGKDEKFFEVTVRLNPEYDASKKGSKEFQVVNATQISKKTHKLTGNVTASGADTKTKVDLSTYTVVPYMSVNMGINSDKLVDECIEYFKNYNLTGITGNLVLFGDFGLTTAMQVELIDNLNPSKNGVYLVDEVTTTFGVNGYRQKITIPYKIKGSNTYGSSK